MEGKNLNWNGPEYVMKKKTTDWYFAIGIIILALVITSLIFKNVMLASILLLGGIIVVFFAKRKPLNINFQIDQTGITVDTNKYEFQNLKSFWIKEDNQDFHKLLIKNNSLVNSIIIIPLPKEYLDKTKEILNEAITEEPIVESALDSFLDRLGF